MSDSISPKATVPKKWVVENLLKVARNKDPLTRVQAMLETILSSKIGKNLAATDATIENLEDLFNISFDLERMVLKPWKLQNEPYEMPHKLKDNLYDLTRVLYDDAVEATGRIAVDMMLIACKLHIMELHPVHFPPKKRKTASTPDTPQHSEARETVKLYPELELAVDMTDSNTNETTHVSQRADWGFGYSGRNDIAHGTFLVAIEAKRRELFSTAEKQLLTYLAILRELRLRAGKKNSATQGFYTDGYRYCFMAINTDGKVESSEIYEVMKPESGKTIFNFIVAILESAMKCSPTVTPTKSAEQQGKEINNFSEEVRSKIYVPYPPPPQTESDGK